jgi:hypothetical protein
MEDARNDPPIIDPPSSRLVLRQVRLDQASSDNQNNDHDILIPKHDESDSSRFGQARAALEHF